MKGIATAFESLNNVFNKKHQKQEGNIINEKFAEKENRKDHNIKAKGVNNKKQKVIVYAKQKNAENKVEIIDNENNY